ncbi:MAG TPA: glycerophosphodiester phosphodiesterase family protein [Nocardioidaceae bacterium]|nr:glycerophosphodiester phosphodiesterase family protein [Nocardioidaceae bacterium]
MSSTLIQTRRPLRRTTTPRPLNIAHRGASFAAPENTLSAVRRAVDFGADMVEVDVQRTKDGVLVLLHDSTLSRTTDVTRVFRGSGSWRVADFTYDQLLRLDAGFWFSRQHVGERIPTLAQTLDLLSGSGVGLQLELKHPERYPGVVDDLIAVLEQAGPIVSGSGQHGVVVQSFHHVSMKELKARMPFLRVGLLGAPAPRSLPVLGTWADQVNPSYRAVDPAYVAAIHDAGMSCHVWTVDRPGAQRRALAMGVDGVITNRPERLGMVLA